MAVVRELVRRCRTDNTEVHITTDCDFGCIDGQQAVKTLSQTHKFSSLRTWLASKRTACRILHLGWRSTTSEIHRWQPEMCNLRANLECCLMKLQKSIGLQQLSSLLYSHHDVIAAAIIPTGLSACRMRILVSCLYQLYLGHWNELSTALSPPADRRWRLLLLGRESNIRMRNDCMNCSLGFL